MTEDRAALVGLKRFRPTLQKYAASRTGYLAVMTDKDDPRDSDWRGEDSRQWVKYEDVAAALAMQPPGDGGRETAAVLRSLEVHAWTSDCGGYALDSQRAAALIREHAALLAAKDKWIEQLTGERFSERNHTALQSRAKVAEQRADAAMGLLREVVEAHTGENIDGCGMTNQQIAAIAAFIAGGAAEVKS